MKECQYDKHVCTNKLESNRIHVCEGCTYPSETNIYNWETKYNALVQQEDELRAKNPNDPEIDRVHRRAMELWVRYEEPNFYE